LAGQGEGPYGSVLKDADEGGLDKRTLRVRDRLRARFGGKAREIVAQRHRRVWITIDVPGLSPVMMFLRDKLDSGHVSTLTARDGEDRYEVLYFMSGFGKGKPNINVTVRVLVPHERPSVPTITKIFPGAELYERELMELFGIEVLDHPDPRHLILPEDWPEGNYPLRKDWEYKWERATPDDLTACPSGTSPKEPEFVIRRRTDVPGGR